MTVESAAAPVDSVAVSPNPAGVSVGNTLQLSATALDAAGNVVTGSSVTWSTANATVASVGETGVVTGNAAGATTISASIDGVVGSASVTVSEVSGSLANECATPQPGWVWCDDFDQDRLGSYFEYNNSNGGFTRASGVGNEGSTGMRVQFSTGQVSAGYLHLAIGRTPQSYFRPADDGTADYTELYWRVYVRNQPGWTGGGARKLSRAFIFASSDSWAQAMVAHVWAGKPPNQNYLYIEPVSGTDASGNLITTKYNDLENFEWLGARKGDTPLFDAPAIGQWHCVEARVTLNDSGASNGIFQLWVNGSLDVERTDLNFVDTYSGYGLNAVYLENYWNEGSPQDQERYLDNFVVSTQPIGCQ